MFLKSFVGWESSKEKKLNTACILPYSEIMNQESATDKFEVFRTALFMNAYFPEYEGEKFCGEGALWHRMTRGVNVAYYPHVLCVCEYLPDGLTKAGRRLRIHNPRGGMWSAKSRITKDIKYSLRIKNAILLNAYSFFCNEKLKSIVNGIETSAWLVYLCRFPGYLLYKNWKKQWE